MKMLAVVTMGMLLCSQASIALAQPVDAVLEWNEISLDAVATDHSGTFGTPDQGGPTRTARALGIIHLAMFDAANSVDNKFQPYLTNFPVGKKASFDVAVATAAHACLVQLYPKQAGEFTGPYNAALAREKKLIKRVLGQLVGNAVAQAILLARTNDGSGDPMSYTPSDQPGFHRVDPLNPGQGFLTPQWGDVTPFSIDSPDDFLLPPPPALDSPEYAIAFNDVKSLGSIDSATRTEEETIIGIFWGYDGSVGLGTPPRLYNQCVRAILATRRTTPIERARIFALVNMAMADAGIAAWDSKYVYNFWRPVLGIREADAGTGPSGLGDGNTETEGDATWVPLGAPNSNQGGDDFTPPFPAYASGHATFGAATFHVLRRVFGTDALPFEFVSDEYNGVTTDSQGVVRPLVVRQYDTMTEAIEENGRSRVYLGVHWQFDADQGIIQGTNIADFVVDNDLRPLRSRR